MRIALRSTSKSLSEAYKAHRTLEAVRDYYGITVSKGTLSRIVNHTEGVSWRAEKQVRKALGIGKHKSYIRPCLDHDPHIRLAQLERWVSQTKREIEELDHVDSGKMECT